MMEIYSTYMEMYRNWWIDNGLYEFGVVTSTASLIFIIGAAVYSLMQYAQSEEYKSIVQKK